MTLCPSEPPPCEMNANHLPKDGDDVKRSKIQTRQEWMGGGKETKKRYKLIVRKLYSNH